MDQSLATPLEVGNIPVGIGISSIFGRHSVGSVVLAILTLLNDVEVVVGTHTEDGINDLLQKSHVTSVLVLEVQDLSIPNQVTHDGI